MKNEHTPGPLRNQGSTENGGHFCRVIQAGTETIATVHNLGRDRRKEYEANAALFAAAPTLAENCEALHDALEKMLLAFCGPKAKQNTYTVAQAMANRAALAALHKARG